VSVFEYMCVYVCVRACVNVCAYWCVLSRLAGAQHIMEGAQRINSAAIQSNKVNPPPKFRRIGNNGGYEGKIN